MRPFYPWVYLACAVLLMPPSWVLAADSQSPDDAQSYAVRLRVNPAPNAALQRLVLPAQTLVHVQSRNYADIRLFNAQGQAAPMARVQVAPVPLESLNVPIDTLASAAQNMADSLRGEAARPLQGAVLDLRQLKARVQELRLAADFPVNQAVHVALETSEDLKLWRPISRTLLYRVAASELKSSLKNTKDSPSLTPYSVNLGGAELAGHYVRLSWEQAAVTLHSARVFMSGDMPQRVSVALTSPELLSPHEFRLRLPFSLPVSALKIVPQGDDVWLPVTVWGRQDAQQPWHLLAQRVVFRWRQNNQEQSADPIAWPAEYWREIKIEADPQTPGFLLPPDLRLEFEPVQMVFLTGQSPLILSAGLQNAPSVFLPIASLMPDYQLGQENTLPLAQADSTASLALNLDSLSRAQTAQQTPKGPLAPKPRVWWGIVAIGALTLGLLAWLLRQQSRQGIE